MLDPLSLSAAVIGIAGFGFKLGETLHDVGRTVADANGRLNSISRDISALSSVFEHLGVVLRQDQAAELCNENFIKTVDGEVARCLVIFKEIESVVPQIGRDGFERSSTVTTFQRFRFPLVESKLRRMQDDIARLKSTLILMLEVINLARKE